MFKAAKITISQNQRVQSSRINMLNFLSELNHLEGA